MRIPFHFHMTWFSRLECLRQKSIGIPWSDRLGRSISVTASSLVMPEALQYLFKHSRNEFVIHNTVHVETIFQGITVTPKLQFSKTGLPFTLVSLGAFL